MNKRELRVGNLVKLNNGTVTEIQSVSQWCNTLDTVDEVDVDSLEPIELTPDWLIKFGFNGDSILGSQTLYKSDNVEIWAYRNDGKFIVDNIKRKIVHIQYVHQLQNLFWCLTGRELELTK